MTANILSQAIALISAAACGVALADGRRFAAIIYLVLAVLCSALVIFP